MPKRFTDLSQLTKAVLRPAVAEEKPVACRAEGESRADKDAAEVLSYFARSDKAARRPTASAPCSDGEGEVDFAAELAAKEAALSVLAEEKVLADERIAELERLLERERDAHDAAVRERNRLQGECGRLQGELRKHEKGASAGASEAPAPVAPVDQPVTVRGVLSAPSSLVEAFQGEVREQVLASLAEALAAAERSGRDRRAEMLSAVLAANRPTGELDRRRAELKQILKDAGGFTDAGTLAALSRIGIKCISGKKHWKLEYADIRMPMSKTPSDYRSAQNCATDMANRCF